MPDSRRPAPKEADYVVVGAGSAGCAVAARLAARGYSVILLEAGGSDERYLVRKPGMVGPLLQVPRFRKQVDWGYTTVAQAGLLGRAVPQLRGKVVGGSSSINAMLWVRGNRANYDAWANEGNPGWDADSVNEHYLRIEDFEDGSSRYRGSGGPIKVTRDPRPVDPILQFNDHAVHALGVPAVKDYNAESQDGVSIIQQNVHAGIRYSAALGYLRQGRPSALHLVSGARAQRINIDRGRATSVDYRDAAGVARTAHARAEVILSAGVFGSAQLLLLSGIGPATHLRTHGIAVRADLPVGDNLQDHLYLATTWDVPGAGHTSTPTHFAGGLVRELTHGGSFLAHSPIQGVAFLRSRRATTVPDVQLHLVPWGYPPPAQANEPRQAPTRGPTLSVMSTLLYPRSRGTVRLASSDPLADPVIDFRYLSEGADVEVLADGIEMIREVMGSSGMSAVTNGETHPGASTTGDDLRQAVRRAADSIFHGVGTCRMGTDAQAVVGPDLSVHGISGLRVADASIMPTITGGNTNAASIMIGEQCAALVSGTHPPRP